MENGSYIDIIDNSGAKLGQIIKVLRNKKNAKLGSQVIIAIKKVLPQKKIKKGSVQKAIIVRNSVFNRRPDGSYLKFVKAGCTITNKLGLPIAKKIIGPVAKELRIMGHLRIISIASIAL